MPLSKTARAAAALAAGDPQSDLGGSDTTSISEWRDKFKVHPAADVFPMMSDDDLAKLGEDIGANGLHHPIILWRDEAGDEWLIDGRNRLEAMERRGRRLTPSWGEVKHWKRDPVAFIIGANLKRRHMTKGQNTDVIVALAKAEPKPDQVDPVSRGGRGKRNSVKAKALEINRALPKEDQVSEPTIKRSIAKAEGRLPQPQRYAARPLPKPRSGKPVVGIDAARRYYLDQSQEPDVDLDAEQEIVIDGLREIAGKRAMARQADDLPQSKQRPRWARR